MARILPLQRDNPAPVRLQDHALEHLQFIRTTMERAGAFTAVPGMGGVAMGVSALAAAWFARRQVDAASWLTVWITEGIVAAVIGALAMAHKARQSGASLDSEPARKFVLGFLPPLFAGALLTLPLYQAGLLGAVAATWLLMYGAAVISAGTFSVRIVPAMGVAFLTLGGLALWAPPDLRDLPLAAGFGGLHIVFGIWIWREYGG
jgi:hypothetical protein